MKIKFTLIFFLLIGLFACEDDPEMSNPVPEENPAMHLPEASHLPAAANKDASPRPDWALPNATPSNWMDGTTEDATMAKLPTMHPKATLMRRS